MPLNWRQSDLRQHLNEMMANGNGGRALTLGIGAVILAPIIIPAVAKVGKPIVKATIKSGLALYEKSKSSVAEAGEVLGDIVAANLNLADGEERMRPLSPLRPSIRSMIYKETIHSHPLASGKR